MDSASNDYIGEDIDDKVSPLDEPWNRVIKGTKRNSDGSPNMGEVSDGYHTFNELYRHRGMLFLAICQLMRDNSWYSRLHSDGTMYDGMFIAGITTPNGSITYHFEDEMFRYFERSLVKYVDRAPEWDGASPEDGLNNLLKTLNIL